MEKRGGPAVEFWCSNISEMDRGRLPRGGATRLRIALASLHVGKLSQFYKEVALGLIWRFLKLTFVLGKTMCDATVPILAG